MQNKPCRLADTDVLIMGAGLSGILAAIAAAETGARVCLLSSSVIFAGSSFYPGTWGLGLIAPETPDDVDNLAETITQLGEDMVIPELVETFAGGIQQQIDRLETMGCQLKRPVESGQREYIPCFDYKNRNWYGIMQKQSVEVLAKRMEQLKIGQRPFTEVVDIVMHGGRVQGALMLDKDGNLEQIGCRALVIAGGGMGGLFRYRLNTSEITAVGQYLALRAGARLINAEFYQMFLGFIDPAPRTIYNEKMFRYTNFCYSGTDRSIFDHMSPQEREKLLEERASHGPFTARLADREVDCIISRVLARDEQGVEISYTEDIKAMEKRPEFIATYFGWLGEKKNLTIDDKVRLGIFYHASNGGICIDADGFTGVQGLFACGEATGGMHGADRIGGLSTANCLVFGNRAGVAAARSALETPPPTLSDIVAMPTIIAEADKLLDSLQGLNSATLMVVREEKSLRRATEERTAIEKQVAQTEQPYNPNSHTHKQLRESLHLRAALTLTDCIQQAALLRRESRGSHYRTDYPDKSPDMGRCIICTGVENVSVDFMD